MIFIIFIILLFGSVLLFGFWMLKWQYSKADRMLDEWAIQNHYKIIDKQTANFGDGPMGRRGAATFVKYRIKVADSEGKTKSGNITLGDEKTGVLSDTIEVKWDN